MAPKYRGQSRKFVRIFTLTPIIRNSGNLSSMQHKLYNTAEALKSLIDPARVHRDVYVREEVFKLEMERIWGQAWIYVGHESQVSAAGEYITTTIGLTPVIMVRDMNGKDIHVLVNRCRAPGRAGLRGPQGPRRRTVQVPLSRLDLPDRWRPALTAEPCRLPGRGFRCQRDRLRYASGSPDRAIPRLRIRFPVSGGSGPPRFSRRHARDHRQHGGPGAGGRGGGDRQDLPPVSPPGQLEVLHREPARCHAPHGGPCRHQRRGTAIQGAACARPCPVAGSRSHSPVRRFL